MNWLHEGFAILQIILNKTIKHISNFAFFWLEFSFNFFCKCSRTFLYLLVRLSVWMPIYLSFFFCIYSCRFHSRHTNINIVLENKLNHANNANFCAVEWIQWIRPHFGFIKFTGFCPQKSAQIGYLTRPYVFRDLFCWNSLFLTNTKET